MVRLSLGLAFLEHAIVVASAVFSTTVTPNTTNTTVAASFIAKDQSFKFALNIPEGDNNDLYFTMVVPSVHEWIAIGMGSAVMRDSLIFMAYCNTGYEVILSPRLSDGNTEPVYNDNVTTAVLPGSMIHGMYIVHAMCGNCRSWKGASIDPMNTAAKFIYALGPPGEFQSNSLSASTNRHSRYGGFTMDLTKAFGVKGVPLVPLADAVGTVQTGDTSHRELLPPAHAALMILAFAVLMPLAVLVLKLIHSPKWHGVAQTASALVALIGVGLGVKSGKQYNRTMHFNSAHQIFGFMVTAAMIGQFVMGLLTHILYKKAQLPTKLSNIHVWLGRGVIPAGIANGFVGFCLARHCEYFEAYFVSLALFTVALLFLSWWKWHMNVSALTRPNRRSAAPARHQTQQWTSREALSDISLARMESPSSHHDPIYYQEPVQGRHFV